MVKLEERMSQLYGEVKALQCKPITGGGLVASLAPGFILPANKVLEERVNTLERERSSMLSTRVQAEENLIQRSEQMIMAKVKAVFTQEVVSRTLAEVEPRMQELASTQMETSSRVAQLSNRADTHSSLLTQANLSVSLLREDMAKTKQHIDPGLSPETTEKRQA